VNGLGKLIKDGIVKVYRLAMVMAASILLVSAAKSLLKLPAESAMQSQILEPNPLALVHRGSPRPRSAPSEFAGQAQPIYPEPSSKPTPSFCGLD
jgi:hypothetical protein